VRENITNGRVGSEEGDLSLRLGFLGSLTCQHTLAPRLRVNDARTDRLLFRSERLSRGFLTVNDGEDLRGFGGTILTSATTGLVLHLRGGHHGRDARLLGRRSRIRELDIPRYPQVVAAGLAGLSLPLLLLLPLVLSLLLWRGLGDGRRRRKKIHGLSSQGRAGGRRGGRTDNVDVRRDDGVGNAGWGSIAGGALGGLGTVGDAQSHLLLLLLVLSLAAVLVLDTAESTLLVGFD
jgi:hypothetical protein